MKYYLYNPLANNGIRIEVPDVQMLDATKLDYSAFFAGLKKEDEVVLIGGDGTVNYLVNHVNCETLENNVYLLSNGTGNDFLHDIEKPWLKLIWGDYKRVQKWHKFHNKHHIFSGRRYGINKVDWLAAVLDWEASRYSKYAAQLNARDEVAALIANTEKYSEAEREEIRKNCYPILDYLGL